jgi:cytoskeletal protein CcmA (bactofilin family)
MREGPTRLAKFRLGLLLAAHGLLYPALAAPRAPAVPEPPEPPSPPEISVQGFRVRPGETHKGDVVRFAPSAAVQGTLDGDMYVTASTVTISGVITGDVFVAGSVVDVSGEIQKSFRAAAANVVLDGTVHGNVLVTGGSLTLGSKAHVMGNVSAYTGQFTHSGVIEGSLTFTGGNAILGGKVLEDASLTADAIEIEPGARIEGDVTYSTRKPMDAQFKAIAGGDVTYDEAPVREKRVKHRKDDDLRPTTFGVGKWIAFFSASFLFGCALLAVFGAHEPKVTAAIGSDTLRCAGIGFVSILVTIAVCLSVILLITIPFVLIYLLGYIIAAYLAKVPVAVWLGRFILGKLKRPSGPYMALFVGLVPIYLVFMIPVFGKIAWFLAAILGLGAMTMTYLAHRQSRKVAVAAA